MPFFRIGEVTHRGENKCSAPSFLPRTKQKQPPFRTAVFPLPLQCPFSGRFIFFTSYNMKLLTQELLKQFRKVWRQDKVKDPLVICKFFYPGSHRTRYATEFDEETRIFFGFVDGDFPERWRFSLTEFEEFRGKRWRMERDLWFDPRPFSELKLDLSSKR